MAMAQVNVADLYKSLGRMEEGLFNLVESVKDVKENQADAAQAREAMASQMIALINRMNDFEIQLKDVKVTTDEVKEWKQRGIGALAIAGFGGSALTWAIMHFWVQVMEMVRTKVGV